MNFKNLIITLSSTLFFVSNLAYSDQNSTTQKNVSVMVSGGLFPTCAFSDSGLLRTGVYCNAAIGLSVSVPRYYLFTRASRHMMYASGSREDGGKTETNSEQIFANMIVAGAEIPLHIVNFRAVRIGVGYYKGFKSRETGLFDRNRNENTTSNNSISISGLALFSSVDLDLIETELGALNFSVNMLAFLGSSGNRVANAVSIPTPELGWRYSF